ncbi:hypothetical protein HQQ80_16860 [Microbacteriaceae bacterium VKM Ac-2855]|nr:hypothetical protein [Microbacteriaceae bacterium VKM Ac-2855]
MRTDDSKAKLVDAAEGREIKFVEGSATHVEARQPHTRKATPSSTGGRFTRGA